MSVPEQVASVPVQAAAPTAVGEAITAYFRRLAGRFGYLFVALYCGPEVIGALPGCRWIWAAAFRNTPEISTWIGVHLLHLTVPRIINHGSGDQVTDYIASGTLLTLSLAGAALWACFDRARRADALIAEICRIGVRYFLALTMLGYGMAKVLHSQMPEPGSWRLLETYGESSPMGLLWTFIGQSAAYSFYTGGLEVAGALLLLFRRTMLLGALLTSATMFNVFILNLCYDVPVKLFSFTLFVLATALAAPAIHRLWNLLALHRATSPTCRVIPLPWEAGRLTRAVHLVLKAAMVCWILWVSPITRVTVLSRHPPASSLLDGIYRVTEFVAKGQALPPLATDSHRWNLIGIDQGSQVAIVAMDGSRKHYRLHLGLSNRFELQSFGGPGTPSETEGALTYVLNGSDLTLSGDIYGVGPVAIHLHRDDTKRLLMTRGFHWISQLPFNR